MHDCPSFSQVPPGRDRKRQHKQIKLTSCSQLSEDVGCVEITLGRKHTVQPSASKRNRRESFYSCIAPQVSHTAKKHILKARKTWRKGGKWTSTLLFPVERTRECSLQYKGRTNINIWIHKQMFGLEISPRFLPADFLCCCIESHYSQICRKSALMKKNTSRKKDLMVLFLHVCDLNKTQKNFRLQVHLYLSQSE